VLLLNVVTVFRYSATFLLALACTKHEPEIDRVGNPPIDASSDAMPAPGAESGVSDSVRWCQAYKVLQDSCQRCHTAPPVNGAPFPLMTYEDTQAPYGTSDFKIWEKMRDAVAVDFMPATFIELDPPVEPLTCEQKSTLLAWLEQGAEPLGGLACTDPDKTLIDCATGGAGGASP
jgi:hypothetical protein